ncbi:MAG: MFS transporter [Candidatus Poriferisodalaceae bacterium]
MATDKGLTRGWSPIISLGVMTCTCYGAAFYAYGILLDPIHKELGWSLTFLGSVFAVAQLISGFGASVAGRLLDRWGGQLVFKIQGAASVVLFTASWTQNAALFAVLMASGLGVMAASGFYHVSTAIAGRVGPSDPGRSIAVLTAIGAFCSPIYLPVGAILINSWGWRAAIQIFAVVAFLGALQASHFAAAGKSDQLSGPSPKALTALRSAMHRPLVRRMLLAYAFAGFSFSTLLVYQVPIMIDQGLALNAAAGIAGFRGFCQLFGRVGVIAAIAKQEATIALRVSYLLAAGGSLFILAGNMWLGFAYGALVGAGLGATTPLQAINAQETFDPEDLGLLMGLQQSVFALAGALGPVLAGIAADVSNSQTPTVWMSVLSLFLAAFLLQGNRSETPS